MSLQVSSGGILSLVVDRGRIGYQHLGVTQGGPMDDHAFLWANRLLGNKANDAQIEITYGLFKGEFTQATHIALTGADLQAELQGERIVPWQTYAVSAGDKLVFKTPKSGMRAYLAVSGGFQVESQLGSCTTVAREQLGGLKQNGSVLDRGDVINFLPQTKPQHKKALHRTFIPNYEVPLELGVMMSYQFDAFDITRIKRFFTAKYEVSQNIDRMGYRLLGEPIGCDLTQMISEGISYGAIQIPSDGQPIILMKDRQTIGGYPKLGCVSFLDAAQLSQRKPGSQVTFRPVKTQDARKNRREFERFFRG